jgi:dienelactone hydrolase
MTASAPSDHPDTLPRWLRALTAASLLLFALGLGLTLLRADVTSLVVGLFGVTRARGALVLLLLAAALATTTLRRVTGRRRSLTQVIVYGSVLVATLGVWADRTPYQTAPVSYRSGDAQMAATLYLPPTPGRHPAVMIVHGSAPFRRMFYDLWADRIARQGFVVLLADKRGVGGSGGEFERNDNTSSENITRLADDVIAGVDYLAARPEVDSAHIGLVGLSQAGWVAPRAAERSARIRFMALITGPSVSTREEEVWSRLRGDDREAPAVARPRAEAVLDTLAPGGVDSRGAIAHLTIPSLWLFGGEDNSIPTIKSVRALIAAAAAGRPVTWNVFDGYGHILVGRRGALLPRVAPESWPVLLNWLAKEGADSVP